MNFTAGRSLGEQGVHPPHIAGKKKKWSQGVLIHWPVTQLTAREQGARPQTPWGVTEAKSCAFLMSHVLSWHRLAVLVCHSSQGENRVNWVCCVPEKLLSIHSWKQNWEPMKFLYQELFSKAAFSVCSHVRCLGQCPPQAVAINLWQFFLRGNSANFRLLYKK